MPPEQGIHYLTQRMSFLQGSFNPIIVWEVVVIRIWPHFTYLRRALGRSFRYDFFVNSYKQYGDQRMDLMDLSSEPIFAELIKLFPTAGQTCIYTMTSIQMRIFLLYAWRKLVLNCFPQVQSIIVDLPLSQGKQNQQN